MLLNAIAESLPMSVGVALSPLAILAIVMILMTAKARTNAPAFLLGWILGLLMVGVIVFIIPASQIAGREPIAAAGYLRIGLGAFLLYYAVKQWRNRPGPDEAVEMPKFLAGFDTFSAGKSLLTGFLLVAIHPKNLLLCAAGAGAIDLHTPNLVLQFGAYAVFTLIASSPIAIPLIVYFLARERAKTLFDSWKDWLIRNNQTVLVVIVVIIGGLILARGLGMVAK
jgi:hypothetical protein